MNPLLIILAVLPALLISYLIYRIDRYDKESHWELIICFILGMLVTYPAIHLEAYGESFDLSDSTHLGKLFLLSFIVVGLTEELAKFIPLLLYGYTRKGFTEPLDGIVYSVMISMGFATLENIIYAEQFGMQTTILRAFTAVPAHAVFGVFMGYYIGLAKFDKKKKPILIATGLLSATAIHGLYDFFILQGYYDWLMIFATLTLSVSLFFAIQLIRLHQQNSPFKEEQELQIAESVEVQELDEMSVQELAVESSVESLSKETENDDFSDAVINEMKTEVMEEDKSPNSEELLDPPAKDRE